VVDIAAVAALLALIAVLASRLSNPVKRLLSGFQDYLAWLLTFLPLATGYLAFHHLLHRLHAGAGPAHPLGRAAAGGAALHQALPHRQRVRLALVQRGYFRKQGGCIVTAHALSPSPSPGAGEGSAMQGALS
jgi:hypothetical protein